jgi:GNAT superfamily N-acetyltransferase
MPTFPCLCGTKLEAADEPGLRAAIDSHLSTAHPDLTLSTQQYEDALAYALRAVQVPPPLEALPPVTIQALTPSLKGDFLHFFDHIAFADNPSWGNCYCNAHMFARPQAEWGDATAAENRDAQIALIEAGQSPGYLAFAGSDPIGFCRAGSRAELPGFVRKGDFAVDNPEEIGVTTCFVIAAAYRRFGIARQLLDFALGDFAGRGLKCADGFPRKQGGMSDPEAFMGPRALYDRAGYVQIGEGARALWMRKTL